MTAKGKEVEEFILKALEAKTEAEKARGIEAVANHDAEEANERMNSAAAEADRAKDVETAARRKVEEARERLIKARADIVKAKETEAAATKELEENIQKANKIPAIVKHALEAENLARSAAKHANDKSNKATQASKEAEGVETKANREVEQEIKKLEAEEAKAAELVYNELYHGSVKLRITPTIGYEQLNSLAASLTHVDGLKILSLGGSAGEGNHIVLSIKSPLPLLNYLGELPIVKSVSKKEEALVDITLKDSEYHN